MTVRSRFDAASRYELDDGGVSSSRIDLTSSVYRVHVVVSGDTVENLAHRLTGNHARWWEIADLNPQLDNYMTLVPGESIRVPA